MSELQRLTREAQGSARQDAQMALGGLGQEVGRFLGMLALADVLTEERAASLVGHWQAFHQEARTVLGLPGQRTDSAGAAPAGVQDGRPTATKRAPRGPGSRRT